MRGRGAFAALASKTPERRMESSSGAVSVFRTLSSRTSAAPWTRTFGNCIFKGDTDGAPLVRAGSCPTQTGTLDLSVKGITLLPANVFGGMANMTLVLCCVSVCMVLTL